MDGESANVVDASPQGATHARQRSTIGFPYMDLEDAKCLAEAIHTNVGSGSCDDDQLAAWSNQSSKSSTFRTQIYAARMFGVLEGDGAGVHRLSDLGRALVDPQSEREARSQAFLNIPLYRALFESHRGGVLPPTAALEREMVSLGVAEKQKEKARQVFERASEQAGFFEQGRNRLVMPGFARGDLPPKSETGEHPKDGVQNKGNGGGEPPLDPLIAALIKKLPPSAPWPTEDRIMWLQMISMAFQMAYGQDGMIEIKKAG